MKSSMMDKCFLTDEICIKGITDEEFDKLNDKSFGVLDLDNKANKISQEDKEFVEKILQVCRDRLGRKIIDDKRYGLFSKNTYIGYVCLANYSTETPEIQIKLIENFRNRGIGYKAVSWVIKQAFTRKDVKYLIYRVLVNNENSLSLIRKLGGKEIVASGEQDVYIKTFHIYRNK